MSSKAGNSLIAAGALLVVVALVCLPAARSEADRASIVAFAASLFSLGTMATAGGFYLKARMMSASNSGNQSADNARRIRGGCDLCAGDAPVIHCKVHQLHMCPACLAQHYDFRSCAYVPSTRKPTSRGRALAKTRGA